MKPEKLLRKILAGSDNVRFDDFVQLVAAFGFELNRVRGSHHIFVHPDIDELLNVQDAHGETRFVSFCGWWSVIISLSGTVNHERLPH